MKRLLSFVLLISLMHVTSPAEAQDVSTLRGKVMDKDGGEPVGWATVALLGQDSTVVAGTSCGADGAFEIHAPEGKYVLTASLLGYKDHAQNIALASGLNDAGVIYLEADAQSLASATLTDRVKLVEVKIDKVVMNVSQSAFAHGSNALELMKKAPGVTVDKDGNVKLNGKAVSVWIDGRPSNVDGKSLEALLMGTNSESIEKFELMEHPSAKYDAAGQGGIINIKTKRNMLQGFNGSLGVSGGAMHFGEIDETPWDQGVTANLSYRTAKTNTFLNVNEGIYNSPLNISSDLEMKDMDFRQSTDGVLLSSYDLYTIKLGNDWFIDDQNTLGAILYVPGFKSSLKSKSSDACQSIGGVESRTSRSFINNGPSSSLQHNINLNYTHIFDGTSGSEVTVNIDYFNNVSETSNSQTDTTLIGSGADIPMITTKSMHADNVYDVYSAKADYQSVIGKKFMLESGAKWALSRTDNNSLEMQTLLPDNPQYFVYSEQIAAAYASLAGQLGEKVSFKAGLRGEYTNSFGDWRSSGTETRRDYLDFFPTVFVGYKTGEKSQFTVSYSRRINRPRYGQLNPVKSYIDAKTYTVGNPDILPQYSSDVSVTGMFGQHFSLSAVYNHAGNLINQIPTFDAEGNQYLTWGNTGKMDMGILSVNVAALPVGKWLQWTLNANGLYLNAVLPRQESGSACWSMQGYTDFTFLLPKDWKIDLDAFASAPMKYGYYLIHSSWSSNLAVKKTLLDNRMTVTFKIDDIFRSFNNNLDLFDPSNPDVHTTIYQIYFNQKVSLDLNWSFGKAQSPMRRRKVGNLEEMSRAGGSNSGGLGK